MTLSKIFRLILTPYSLHIKRFFCYLSYDGRKYGACVGAIFASSTLCDAAARHQQIPSAYRDPTHSGELKVAITDNSSSAGLFPNIVNRELWFINDKISSWSCSKAETHAWTIAKKRDSRLIHGILKRPLLYNRGILFTHSQYNQPQFPKPTIASIQRKFFWSYLSNVPHSPDLSIDDCTAQKDLSLFLLSLKV